MSIDHATAGGHVIAIGAGGQLTIGGRLLPIEPARLAAPGALQSPALMLHSRYGIVPYVAADALPERLAAWVDSDERYGARIIGGEGGVGKTRLAVEQCTRLDQRVWIAGFLTASADAEALEALANAARPRLVVVDYAEARLEQLNTVLPLFQDRATAANPVRVLLLMRRAHRSSIDERDRWIEPLRQFSTVLAVQSEAMEVDEMAPAPVDSAYTKQLFDQAATAFASQLRSASRSDMTPPRDLRSARALDVLVRAYQVANGEDASPTTDLALSSILDHEARYWSRRADEVGLDLSPRLMRRAIAAATLVGAKDRDEARNVLRHLHDLADAPNERVDDVAEWLHRVYPGPDFWNPLEPDAIGERLVATELGDDPDLDALTAAATTQRPILVLSRLDPVEAPRAQRLLAENIETLSLDEALLVSFQLEDLERPDELARALTEASQPGPYGDFILESVAGLARADFDTRVGAIELLVDRLDRGYPWRLKDLERGELWKESVIGVALLDLLASDQRRVQELLEAWIDDERPVSKDLDAVTRRTIATNVLVSQAEQLIGSFEVIAKRSPDAFAAIARVAGPMHPGLMLELGRGWARSNDDALRLAAVSLASGVAATSSAASTLVPQAILEPLVDVRWPGRSRALSVLIWADPDRPDLIDLVLAAVASRQLPISALRNFRASDAEVVLRTLDAAEGHDDVDQAVGLIEDWFPSDAALEARAMAIVERAEADPRHAWRVARVAELAVYEIRRDHPVSDRRENLILRTLTTGEDFAKTMVFYGLATPPGPPRFESFRTRALAALDRSAPPASVYTDLIGEMFRHPVTEGWPALDDIQPLLASVAAAERTEVVLDVIARDLSDRAATVFAEWLEGGASADPRLEAFNDVYRTTADKWAALRSAHLGAPDGG